MFLKAVLVGVGRDRQSSVGDLHIHQGNPDHAELIRLPDIEVVLMRGREIGSIGGHGVTESDRPSEPHLLSISDIDGLLEFRRSHQLPGRFQPVEGPVVDLDGAGARRRPRFGRTLLHVALLLQNAGNVLFRSEHGVRIEGALEKEVAVLVIGASDLRRIVAADPDLVERGGRSV